MFNKSLTQVQALDSRFQQEPHAQGHLQPDGRDQAGWLRRLQRLWGERPLQGARMAGELFVPDDCLGLLFRNGEPERWFEPGRHPLTSAKAKLELRLIPAEHLADQPGDRLELLQRLPFERALLYVDGVHVASVKPGLQAERPQRERPGHSRQPFPSLHTEVARARSEASDSEDDLIQDFLFI